MSLGQIYEGWKNHLLPTERIKEFVEHVAEVRMDICIQCDEHSFNKENYKSIRPDAHCTNCGCTLAAKTKCLTCECPLKKWMAAPIPTEDENS